MKDYIIDHPQLQSLQKRLGSLVVWAVCWLMWIYLLVPLATLAGWLLGEPGLNDEMFWFGGYGSLLDLLKKCLTILAAQALFWLCWVLLRVRRKRRLPAAALKPLDDAELCSFYRVDADELTRCRNARQLTVYFDKQGIITHLEPSIACKTGSPSAPELRRNGG